MWDFSHGLGISALPTRASLALFRTLGFTDLVNVSGSATGMLYTHDDLGGLSFADFPFPDALSTAAEAAEIVATLGPAGMREFKSAAMRAAEHLSQQRRVIVFCHLGIGRSPAVSIVALMLARRYSIDDAVRVIARLRPKAALGSAVLEFAEQVHAELAADR